LLLLFWTAIVRKIPLFQQRAYSIIRFHMPDQSQPPKVDINRHAPKPVLARFVLVNACTAANLTLGVLSILSTMTGYLTLGALLLLASVVLDMLDGNLARRWRVTTEFGAQMDSLADMVAFTVASAMLAWYWLSPKLPEPWMATAACALYVLMGAIRLARFNSGPANTSYFQGVPTTVVAGIVATTYLLSPQFAPGWALVLFLLLAILMVSTLPYGKFTLLARLPRALWLLVAAGLVLNTQLTVIAVEALYLLSGPFVWWRARKPLRG
jgi:CDP-diacylglycerol---serine O-phosphatidyltransferase